MESFLSGNVGANPVRSGVSGFSARLSATLLRLRGVRIARYAKISLHCRVFAGQSVKIGENTEILRNCTIDGSKNVRSAIVIGRSCRIKENVWLASYEGTILIGNNVLIGRNSVIHGHGGVTLGDSVMLGPGCMIFSNEHIVRPGAIFQELGHVNLATKIGRNVWLGAGVVVTGGSIIGDDIVVAAGSVVHGRLDRAGLYGGTPVKFLKRLEDMKAVKAEDVRHWNLEE